MDVTDGAKPRERREKKKSLKLLEAEGALDEDTTPKKAKKFESKPTESETPPKKKKKQENGHEETPEPPKEKLKVKTPKPGKPAAAGAGDSAKAKKPADAAYHTQKPSGVRCQSTTCMVRPYCSVNATKNCVYGGSTSRWYHLSHTEHYCNQCFEHFYRPQKPGSELVTKWKARWVKNSKIDPSLKVYIITQALPYWAQCQQCGKWRQLPHGTDLTVTMAENYVCDNNVSDKKDPCDEPEDPKVSEVLEPAWMKTMSTHPYLQHSPAIPFLRSHYLPDSVGISSTECTPPPELDDKIEQLSPYFHPFNHPTDPGKALSTSPDLMEPDEREEFPQFVKDQQMYLGLRNLVLALWNLNCKQWLTPEVCQPYVLCRGMVRIRCIKELEKIIKFLMWRGVINTGLVPDLPPAELRLEPEVADKCQVLVVGGGPAGLAAARHLYTCGVKVEILEARDRLCGRVEDDNSWGVCLGKGAQIVNGCINNPISLLCEQTGYLMKHIKDTCDLIDEQGKVVDSEMDRRIDFHFNAMLDIVAEWRKDKNADQDENLLDKIREMHSQFLEQSELTFSDEDERLFQFHISNLEYACGASLSNVSSLKWDQNECYPQFGGDHTMMQDGYAKVLERLANNIKVHYKTVVTDIDYSDEAAVKVTTKSGKVYKAGKVLVTVPLTVLKKGMIKFTPVLPPNKVNAVKQLGAGIVEKVIVSYPERFWEKKCGDSDFFGHIPPTEEKRGLFSIFYDMSIPEDNTYVLMTYVSGDTVKLIQGKSDEEVGAMVTETLRKMFVDADVPEPSGVMVTNWQDDEFSGMAYSYVPVGASGDAYDQMSKDVLNRVYFAGEATMRHFPQTVTGAYLSGIREGSKILENIAEAFSS